MTFLHSTLVRGWAHIKQTFLLKSNTLPILPVKSLEIICWHRLLLFTAISSEFTARGFVNYTLYSHCCETASSTLWSSHRQWPFCVVETLLFTDQTPGQRNDMRRFSFLNDVCEYVCSPRKDIYMHIARLLFRLLSRMVIGIFPVFTCVTEISLTH